MGKAHFEGERVLRPTLSVHASQRSFVSTFLLLVSPHVRDRVVASVANACPSGEHHSPAAGSRSGQDTPGVRRPKLSAARVTFEGSGAWYDDFWRHATSSVYSILQGLLGTSIFEGVSYH